MIEPTVGRVVWYFDRAGYRSPQPHAAIIAFVHSPAKVNLTVLQPSGETFAVQDVALWQGEEHEKPPAHAFCQWMPHQKGQAAKNVDPRVAALGPEWDPNTIEAGTVKV